MKRFLVLSVKTVWITFLATVTATVTATILLTLFFIAFSGAILLAAWEF